MYEYRISKVLSVYDGDTITVEVDLGFGVTKKEKFRLALIDTPELRGDEREAGLISRDWLRERFNNAEANSSPIILKTYKDRKGKYGRYIAEIIIGDVNINKLMLAEGLAKAY